MDEHLLDYRLTENTDLVLASPIKRMINWLYDIIFFIAILIALHLIDFPVLIIVLNFWWYFLIALPLYFVIIEVIMNGKSIGKHFTHTRVVTEHGYKPEISVYLIRAIARMVPISAISLFSAKKRTYYDIFSKTFVIDEKLSSL